MKNQTIVLLSILFICYFFSCKNPLDSRGTPEPISEYAQKVKNRVDSIAGLKRITKFTFEGRDMMDSIDYLCGRDCTYSFAAYEDMLYDKKKPNWIPSGFIINNSYKRYINDSIRVSLSFGAYEFLRKSNKISLELDSITVHNYTTMFNIKSNRMENTNFVQFLKILNKVHVKIEEDRTLILTGTSSGAYLNQVIFSPARNK